jgi:hypothetical protein
MIEGGDMKHQGETLNPQTSSYTCKRDLLYMLKRQTIHVKETYYTCKRDPQIRKPQP